MTRNMIFAAALASATALAPAAFAASNGNTSDQTTASSKSQTAKPVEAASRDFTQLSKEGFNAFHDIRLARLAIFQGETKQAVKLVSSAQASFKKAENDRTSFMKAMADIKPPQGANQNGMNGNTGQSTASSAANGGQGETTRIAQTGDDNGKPVNWLPIDAQVNLAKGYTVTADNTQSVNKANQSLKQGDRKGALDTLKLAGIDVQYTMALAPVDKTWNQLQAAAKDLNANKFYEANLDLKAIEDSVVLDAVNVVGTPATKTSSTDQTKDGQQAKTANSTVGQATDGSDRTTTGSTSAD
ncbi:YfdX family protein [Aurantimonas sp. VKM B-3413]|uniref:YfdX family protein n=1 Tax=Aurantimonas sp. VKM B-3413 TaxID=2779401 RepID=UPI001E36CD3C|nr:YfdX family protein [Aurantimonas sp. VKM B-3413]MCB8840793.1 YfdX family protein [Aurantimonas sp. VKM B-3413]